MHQPNNDLSRLPKDDHAVLDSGTLVTMTDCAEMIAEAKDLKPDLWNNIFDDAFPSKGRPQDSDSRQVAYTSKPDGSPTLGIQRALIAMLSL